MGFKNKLAICHVLKTVGHLVAFLVLAVALALALALSPTLERELAMLGTLRKTPFCLLWEGRVRIETDCRDWLK